jgi:hypothetical protein
MAVSMGGGSAETIAGGRSAHFEGGSLSLSLSLAVSLSLCLSLPLSLSLSIYISLSLSLALISGFGSGRPPMPVCLSLHLPRNAPWEGAPPEPSPGSIVGVGGSANALHSAAPPARARGRDVDEEPAGPDPAPSAQLLLLPAGPPLPGRPGSTAAGPSARALRGARLLLGTQAPAFALADPAPPPALCLALEFPDGRCLALEMGSRMAARSFELALRPLLGASTGPHSPRPLHAPHAVPDPDHFEPSIRGRGSADQPVSVGAGRRSGVVAGARVSMSEPAASHRVFPANLSPGPRAEVNAGPARAGLIDSEAEAGERAVRLMLQGHVFALSLSSAGVKASEILEPEAALVPVLLYVVPPTWAPSGRSAASTAPAGADPGSPTPGSQAALPREGGWLCWRRVRHAHSIPRARRPANLSARGLPLQRVRAIRLGRAHAHAEDSHPCSFTLLLGRHKERGAGEAGDRQNEALEGAGAPGGARASRPLIDAPGPGPGWAKAVRQLQLEVLVCVCVCVCVGVPVKMCPRARMAARNRARNGCKHNTEIAKSRMINCSQVLYQ